MSAETGTWPFSSFSLPPPPLFFPQTPLTNIPRRFGPLRLSSRIPLSASFATYSRLGGYCPGPFLAEFYNATTSYWIYPSDLGYSLDTTTGSPIKGNVTLPIGTLIDRFGGEGGNFSSPAGAPYMQRSLPPSNLDVQQDDYPR